MSVSHTLGDFQAETLRTAGTKSGLAEDWQCKTDTVRTKLMPRPSERPCGINTKLSFLELLMFKSGIFL